MPPAMTSTSLLASAMVLPHSMAASTASRPSVPDDAHSTRSASGCDATATRPSRPGSSRRSCRPAHRRSREPIDRRGVGHGRNTRPVARDLLGEQLGVLAGGEADDLQPVGMRVDDRQRALADRAGRAEDGDAFHRQIIIEHDVVDRRRKQQRVDAIEDAAVARESAPSCP